MCCLGPLGMSGLFWSKKNQQLPELAGTIKKESDAQIPLLESNLLVFESFFDNEKIPLADRIEIWLDDSSGCGHRKQKKDKRKPIAWVNFFMRQSRNSSLSDTPRQSQLSHWVWDLRSSTSGFSDFA
jgi:hypothetical protein